MRAAFVLAAWLCCATFLSAAEEKARPIGYGPLPRGAWACLGSPRFVGDNPARSVAFSPDGKWLAVGTSQYDVTKGTDVHLWDLASGREVHRLRGHRAQIIALRFTRDGKRLISAAWDHTIRVWDLEKGKEERQFKGHDRVITGLELTPDGKQVVSSSQDDTIRVWDFASGKEVRRMKCWAYAMSLSSDGRTLAAVTGPNLRSALLLWDIRRGEQLRQLGKPEDRAAPGVCFAPDGKTLAVFGAYPEVSLWDSVTGKKRLQIKGLKRRVAALTFSPDSKILATGGGGYEQPGPFPKNFLSELKLWDVASGKLLRSCEGPTYGTADVAFSPDGRMLAWACETTIRLFETSTRRKIGEFHGHRRHVSALAFHPDGRTLASGGADGAILFWDLTGHRRQERYVCEVVKKDDLPALWKELADSESGRRAMWRLILSPDQAVPFVQQGVPVVPKADPQRVRRLLADLDSDSFTTRESATRELAKLGDAVVPALQRTLKEKPTPEVVRRVKGLLEGIESRRRQRQQRLSLPTLQTLRAMEVLERIGTPEARRVLRTIADGEPTSLQTREAQAALTRLR